MEYIEGRAGKDIIFIHGAGLSANEWLDVIGMLSGDSKAYVLNLPGHPVGELTCRTVEQYAKEVERFISERRGKKVLCGHSMGGAIALRVALSQPESVSGLLLVSTAARLPVSRRILEGLKEEPLRTIEDLITPLSFYKANERLTRKAREVLSLKNMAVFLNDFLACDAFDVTGELKYLSVKTMIVCGEQDRMTPVSLSHFLKQNIADSKLFIVRNSGHMLPLEKPSVLSELISSFLMEV